MDNKLQDLLNRDDCYFIHYASNGFYNGSSSAPNISCIVIFNKKNNQGYRFTLKDHIQGHSKEEAERLSLEKFRLLFDCYPNVSFIHWNMTTNGFGFNAIQTRAKELGVDLPKIPDENLFDLSSYVAYIAEKKLSIKQILWFNSLLYGDDFLDGKTEAEYFDESKYEEIYNSLELKVKGFAEITTLIEDNKLKTEPPYENNDGLTEEERREQALKIVQAREEVLNDMVNYNKLVLQKSQQALDKHLKNADNEVENAIDRYFDKKGIKYKEEYYHEEEIFFFSFAHPFISLFANLFANRK